MTFKETYQLITNRILSAECYEGTLTFQFRLRLRDIDIPLDGICCYRTSLWSR